VADRHGEHCTDRPLVTVPRALGLPREKARAHRVTGAVAVDMESAAIARVAGELRIPYFCIRVVLDGPGDTLPAHTASDAYGRLQPLKVLRVMTRPRAFVALAATVLRLRNVTSGVARILRSLLDEELGA